MKITSTTIDSIHGGINLSNSYLSVYDNLKNTKDTITADNNDTREGYTNTTIATLNSIVPTYNALNTAKDLMGATNFATLGFNIGADVFYTRTEAETTQTLTNNKSSNILSNNGNININSEKDIDIKGSNVLAGVELNENENNNNDDDNDNKEVKYKF